MEIFVNKAIHEKLNELEKKVKDLKEMAEIRLSRLDTDRHIQEDILRAGLLSLEKKMKKLENPSFAKQLLDSPAKLYIPSDQWSLLEEQISKVETNLTNKIRELQERIEKLESSLKGKESTPKKAPEPRGDF